METKKYERPDSQQLLRRIQLEEEEKLKKTKGKLKIFLGYAAGSGKTYAMLTAAHEAKKHKIDVVAGYIEPHDRPDTQALVEGLETIAPMEVVYKGVKLREFNLDAALKRNPRLILVDELAHTNVKGCRNEKRYQDVKELLRAGIDVYTTMNVQHLESFLLYYPDQEIASRFNKSTDKKALIWDFQQKSPERMKRQIFQSLQKLITDDYSNDYRVEKLGHLRYFYNFCSERGIEDIEYLEAEEEVAFRQYLIERKKKPNRIIDYCREVLFTEAKETNWNANVWYLSRFCFEKERVNQSNMVRTVTFQTVRHLQNRRLFQEYMKYGIGLSTLSLSSLREEAHYIQSFLAYYNETEFEDARKLTGENIDRFFKYIGEKKLHPNTFNRYVKAVDHFYQYLLTRYQVKRIPFHKEYYLKTEIYRHHDRSVDEVISKEILKNLQYFPEDIRLMYLHLWAVGMRISEVCTIKAKEYYRQDDDYWMQIYQVKMRNYKRIPIPEVLYRLMQVYIKKKRRKPEDYVFQNKKGGAFCSSTFRERMKKLCETYQIGDGTYIFQAHGYRHTLATVFYDEGVPLQSVRDYLGHAYEEMTQQYIDYMPRWIDEASKAYFKETDNSLSVGLKERWKHGGSHRHKDTTMLPESN